MRITPENIDQLLEDRHDNTKPWNASMFTKENFCFLLNIIEDQRRAMGQSGHAQITFLDDTTKLISDNLRGWAHLVNMSENKISEKSPPGISSEDLAEFKKVLLESPNNLDERLVDFLIEEMLAGRAWIELDKLHFFDDPRTSINQTVTFGYDHLDTKDKQV